MFFCHNRRPQEDSLILKDSRGDDSGRWVDPKILVRVLSRGQHQRGPKLKALSNYSPCTLGICGESIVSPYRIFWMVREQTHAK